MYRVLVFIFFSLLYQHGFSQFTLSPNKRYLLKDGKAFFWMGDTAWELFHRLNREEVEIYLKRRAEQGFNLVQAVVLAEMDGLRVPNAYGNLPLIDEDPSKPNEKYFEHVDYIIDRAAFYNINIGLLPSWGDKVYKDKWGKGPEVFTVQNAEVYAGWLAKRYRSKTNLIWILGGDRIPRDENDLSIWNAMGRVIRKETGDRAMITYHSQPNRIGSAEYFLNEDWLTFNMIQNGHCRDLDVYNRITAMYNLNPVRPVIDGEPIYEDHPVCFNANDLGTSNAYDVRKAAYLDLFAGAFGHTYGCHDIWQMYSPATEAVNGPHHYWYDALELPGAKQMIHVRNLMEAYPLLERVPDQSLILENNYPSAERIQATRGKDYVFVYTSTGKPFTLLLGKISGKRLKGFWYDPRNGKASGLMQIDNTGQKIFNPPSSGYGKDWILIVEDAEKKYPGPAGAFMK